LSSRELQHFVEIEKPTEFVLRLLPASLSLPDELANHVFHLISLIDLSSRVSTPEKGSIGSFCLLVDHSVLALNLIQVIDKPIVFSQVVVIVWIWNETDPVWIRNIPLRGMQTFTKSPWGKDRPDICSSCVEGRQGVVVIVFANLNEGVPAGRVPLRWRKSKWRLRAQSRERIRDI
jgi:hypothetical protein